MKLQLTVALCTHNPRQDYLDKTLLALKQQSLPCSQWEFLLIDNASHVPVSEQIDLNWHPASRYIREEKLGLTQARLRGIREAQSDMIIFVDDDNVLEPDYLENSLKIAQDYPFLGSWGGQIVGEFETLPPDWTKEYLPILAIREFSQDQWSNLLHQHQTTPCGAGICVRKIVAEHYARLVAANPLRMGLDRKGNLLSSCGDTDLAFVSCDLGLGTGQFVNLKLTHLIPAARLEESYLLRLTENMAYSHTILDSFRNKFPAALSWKQFLASQLRGLLLSPQGRRFFLAAKRGKNLAIQELRSKKAELKSYALMLRPR
jgi:glycosyltransferase involved in cell wall biosynthesis